MAEPLKLSIRTRNEDGEPVGFDSCILPAPDDWYRMVGGQRAILLSVVGAELRAVSELEAGKQGETLHHADWAITSDPEAVSTLGLAHGCAACRAGVDQALAHLREHEGGEIAVGQLYWAAE